MKRIPDLGRHVFGAAAIIFGIAGLVWGDFAANWQPVRSVPYHTPLAYLAAICLLSAGIAVQWRRSARPALLVLAFWYMIFAGFWLPRVILFPRIAGTWSGFGEQFCLVVAAMMAYATLAAPDARWSDAIVRVGRVLFGLCLISFGVVHFEALKQTADLVPDWLPPNQRFWAAATGVAHLLAGVAIVTGIQALLAARLQTAMFVGFGLLVWLPRFVAHPAAHNVWGGNAMNLAAAGAAWIVADILRAQTSAVRATPRAGVRTAATLACAVAMTLGATAGSAQTAPRHHTGAEAHVSTVDPACCPVVELRRYSLHPGTRETLITLFDREFVDAQEADGIRVIGQYRDIDHPDFFTWMRGFPDMASRATSLGKFYFGPVWARWRSDANATMISSDNVRLLQPTHPRAGIVMSADRPAPGATAIPPGLVVVTIYTLTSAGAEGFADWFERTVAPRLTASGARPIAAFETNPSVNTFPRLPVREGEHAFVWVASLADVRAYDAYVAALAADSEWRTSVRASLEHRFAAPAEVWRLVPTARSRTVR